MHFVRRIILTLQVGIIQEARTRETSSSLNQATSPIPGGGYQDAGTSTK